MEPEGSLPCLQETANRSCLVLSYLHLGLTNAVLYFSIGSRLHSHNKRSRFQKCKFVRNMNYKSKLLCKRMNNYVSLVDLFTRSIFKVLDPSALKQTMYWFSNFLHKYRINMNRDNSAGIAAGYGLDDREVGVPVPVGTRIVSSPRRPDLLWGPFNLLS
jgi:hypothetical protein